MLVRNVLNTACTLDYYENTSHTGLFCDVIRVNSYIYFYISFFLTVVKINVTAKLASTRGSGRPK